MLRRLRGILVTGVLWTIVWSLLGLLFGTGIVLFGVFPTGPFTEVTRFLLVRMVSWGIWGGLSGAAFAALLAIGERRHSLADLTGARIAAWGALGGALVPLGMYFLLAVAGVRAFGGGRPPLLGAAIAGLVGAGLAAGQLALARRAPGALPRGRPALPPE